MTRLPIPVKDVLSDRQDEVAVERVWHRLESRPAPRRWVKPALLVPALAAAAAVVTVFAWQSWPRVVRPASPSGPLQALQATGPVDLERALSATDGLALALSDGSQLSATAGTRLEPFENSSHAVGLLLARGEATFDIKPGGPRRWTIEAGLATVEVVGTRFTLRREEKRLSLKVERGVVLIRGDRVPDRARRLKDGEALELSEPEVVAPPPAPEPAPAPPRLAIAPPPTAPVQVEWASLAQRGDYRGAFEMLGEPGLRQELARVVDDPQQLLALADVARMSGHPALAVAPLSSIVQRHRASPDAPLAAFTLGKIELDALGHPAKAAEAFGAAIELKAPQGLVEAAWARLVEAHSRAGNRDRARAAAAEYDKLFPAGQHRREVEGWLRSPRDE
jgi:transmembrane sensor